MTSAALADLQARIASNTLTALQQAALTTALAAIVPTFPNPDESASIVSVLEEPLAREWIAALYTINGEGVAMSGLPTNQTAWHVNATTGSDTNDGLTAGTAVKTVAQIALRWKGTAGGGRPQLSPSTGTQITIFIDSDLPNSDPLSVLLDVDLAPGMTLLFQGFAKVATKVGSMTTASTFARTHAGGQQTFTDATVANFGVFVGGGATPAMLITDTTAPRGSVAWLVGPDPGASATATSSVFYTAQTPGTISVPTIVQPLAADGYTLTALASANIGNGFNTRQFPQNAQSGLSISSTVIFYRIHFPLQGDVNDTCDIGGNPEVFYAFQECQNDLPFIVTADGFVTFINCLEFHTVGSQARAGGVLEYISGASSNGTNASSGAPSCIEGGTLVMDCDVAVLAVSGAIICNGGELSLGNVSHWGTSSSCVVAQFGANVVQNPILQATSVLYGSDGGDFVAVGAGTAFGPAKYTYSQTGSGTPAADQFKSTNTAFLLGRAPSTSSWGISATTGLAVGATTNTIAHLDAAIGAGTGFGSTAVDPATMSTLSVAA